MAGLEWIRLDTAFFANPKIMDLVDRNQHRAVTAHLSMMCHVGRTGGDGYFAEGALRRYGVTKKDATMCVDAGLWLPAPGGWEINDWAEYQVSDEAAKARSDKARKAAQKRWANRNGGAYAVLD